MRRRSFGLAGRAGLTQRVTRPHDRRPNRGALSGASGQGSASHRFHPKSDEYQKLYGGRLVSKLSLSGGCAMPMPCPKRLFTVAAAFIIAWTFPSPAVWAQTTVAMVQLRSSDVGNFDRMKTL